MTDSIREQILAQMVTTLAGTTNVSTHIYRSREEPAARGEMPLLVVLGGPARVVQPTLNYLNWEMDALVEVLVSGTVPDKVADPIVQSVHSKLMADRTLNNTALSIDPISYNPIMLEGDNAPAVIQLGFRVRYRTSITDLTT